MHTFNYLSLLGLAVLSSHAAPISDEIAEQPNLVRRLGNNDASTDANAKDIEIDCLGQVDNCDQDAYAKLCLGAPSVLQRNSATDVNRQWSGAARQPFAETAEVRGRMGIDLPPAPAGQQPYDSAEEYPFASSSQGGFGAFLFPNQQIQQSHQGNALAYAIKDVPDKGWYNIKTYKNCGRPYCRAYNSEPKDYSVCTKKNVDPSNNIDWADWAYRRVSDPGERYFFQHMGRYSGLGKRDADGLSTNITEIEPEVSRRDATPRPNVFPKSITKNSIVCTGGKIANDGTFNFAHACLADYIEAQSNVGKGVPVSKVFCSMGTSTMAMCSYSGPNYGGHQEVDHFNGLADQKCGQYTSAYLFIKDWNKTYWRSGNGMADVCTNLNAMLVDVSGKGTGPN